MLFNSSEFVFLFIPSVLFVYWLVTRGDRTAYCVFVLAVASLFFYGYWRSEYLALLPASIGGNYLFARLIFNSQGAPEKRWLLILGVIFNLVLLGYFKSAVFSVENAALAFGETWPIKPVVLPLATSFLTFQKIA